MANSTEHATPPTIFETGRNCWRVEKARRATVLIDAENYFRNVRLAMAKAKKRIVLMGWDFDTRIKMHDTTGNVEGPLEIGKYIDWLVRKNPDLEIYILRWNLGMIKTLFRGRTLFTVLRWFVHRRIHMKFDGKHPVGAAHHHKIVVIDDDTAFCGGIDITEGRWDTRAHQNVQPFREQPDNKDGGPWHDVATIMQGPVARALGEFAKARWNDATGKEMKSGDSDGHCWPENLDAMFEDVDIGIARTTPAMKDQLAVYEIEQLYLDLIKTAQDHIYAESQYFASKKIARAIVERLEEENGPEIVIVNPVSSAGWLEPLAMDTVRSRLVQVVMDHDKYDRFRLYHALNEAGEEIYIHAKIFIVDDRIVRVGSSNFNNRSLGFDTEVDVAIDAGPETCTPQKAIIARIRADLLAEHLNSTPEKIAKLMDETGSLIQTIQLSRGSGRTLLDYQAPELNEVEEWLSENNILDPASTDDNFAAIKPG